MKKTNNAIVVTSIIAGVVLIIGLVAFGTLNSMVPSQGDNTVNVEGIATVNAMPDLISVYFNVETNADTSVEAKDANAEIVEKVILALMMEGFDRKDIVTENFNIYQDYDWSGDERTENGFVASHSIKVEIDVNQSDDVGEIIDAGVDAGAKINYINFELTQESQNKYKAEAMKLAAEDARVKAEAVAEGFGKDVGKLVSVNVNDFGYSPWNLYSGGGIMEVGIDSVGMAKESVTNIQPGERGVMARVSAVYKLK